MPKNAFVVVNDVGEPQQANPNNQETISEDGEKKENVFRRIKKKRGWFSFSILLIGGTLVLSGPGVIIGLMNPETVPIFGSEDVVKIQQPLYQTIRYSVWLTFTWIIYVVSSFLLKGLPKFIEHVIEFIFGRCSEMVRQKLNFLLVIHSWMHAMVTAIGSVVMFSIVFYQKNEIQSWSSVFQILTTIMIFSIVLLLQRLFVQNLAFNFHQVSYQQRISILKEQLEMLDNISQAIRRSGLARVFHVDGDDSSVDSQDHPVQGQLKNPIVAKLMSQSPLPDEPLETSSLDARRSKEFVNINFNKYLSEPILSLPRTVQEGKSTMHTVKSKNLVSPDTIAKDIKDNSLPIGERDRVNRKSTFELYADQHAIELAHELHSALTGRDDTVTLEELQKYFDEDHEALEAFSVFDHDANGAISLQDLESTVLKIYREKRALTDALGDLSEALGNLNRILYVFSFTITILLSFGIKIETILPFTSLILALSFIFGNSARATFQCIVFLFINHPYDSGDLIFFDGSFYVVKEISILQTTLTIEGKIIYIPNGI
jgi:hypothetical protein